MLHVFQCRERGSLQSLSLLLDTPNFFPHPSGAVTQYLSSSFIQAANQSPYPEPGHHWIQLADLNLMSHSSNNIPMAPLLPPRATSHVCNQQIFPEKRLQMHSWPSYLPIPEFSAPYYHQCSCLRTRLQSQGNVWPSGVIMFAQQQLVHASSLPCPVCTFSQTCQGPKS